MVRRVDVALLVGRRRKRPKAERALVHRLDDRAAQRRGRHDAWERAETRAARGRAPAIGSQGMQVKYQPHTAGRSGNGEVLVPGDARRPPRQATCSCTATLRPASRCSPHPPQCRGQSTGAALCCPSAPSEPPIRLRAHQHERRRHLDNLPLQPQTAPRALTTRESNRVVVHHSARDRVRCGTRRPRPPSVVLLHPLTATRDVPLRMCHRVVARNPTRDRGSYSTRSAVAPSTCRYSCKPPRAPQRPASAAQGGHRRRSPTSASGCARVNGPVTTHACRPLPAAATQKPAEECHGATTAPAGPLQARNGLQLRYHSLQPLSR